MKQIDNYGLEKGAKEKGFNEGEYQEDEKALDDSPKNSRWDDIDDGGFLGRSKGQER
jgi:hypothetical protein